MTQDMREKILDLADRLVLGATTLNGCSDLEQAAHILRAFVRFERGVSDDMHHFNLRRAAITFKGIPVHFDNDSEDTK